MRACVQLVSSSQVVVEEEKVGAIDQGLLVLLGVSTDDDERDVNYLADKVAKLRIFADDEGKMNLSVQDVGGAMLVISQFTLYGDCRKGNRPSYITAAQPEEAERLYELFVDRVRSHGIHVETGRFRTHMVVSLTNQGPVTLLLESKKQF